MSNYYGTVTLVSGTKVSANIGASGLSGVLLGNESGLTVIVTMEGANTSRSLYPGTVDWFPIPIKGTFNGNLFFMPTANLNNAASWPSSYVQIDTFGPGEAPTGTYPMALPRNTNVGNTIPLSSSATSITNDSNTANTSIVESTVSGDTGSAVSLTNDGNLNIGTTAHKGTFNIKGTLSTDNGVISTDGSGNLTFTGGSLLIPNSFNIKSKDTGGTVRAIIYEDGSNNTVIRAAGNNNVLLQDVNAANLASFSGSGACNIAGQTTFAASGSAVTIPSGSLNVTNGNSVNSQQYNLSAGSGNYSLLTNSLSRWSDFSGTGNVTVNHNLNAAPSFAWAWCDAASSSQTMGNTTTTTQVTVTTGAALHWHGCAVRY